MTDFDQISGDARVQDALRELYGHVDRIEFFPGLFAEDARPNSVLPSLIGRMVGVDAFSQALTNPLLAPRVFNERTFSPLGMQIIGSTGAAVGHPAPQRAGEPRLVPRDDDPAGLGARLTAYHSLADVYEFLTPEPLLEPAGQRRGVRFVDRAGRARARLRVRDRAAGGRAGARGSRRRTPPTPARTWSAARVRPRRGTVSTCARACARGRTFRRRVTSTSSSASATRSRTPATASPRCAAWRARCARAAGSSLTSRNWEREQPDDRYEVERGGRRAVVTYAWTTDGVDIAVSVAGETVAEHLVFWPFTRAQLDDDLRAAGLTPSESTFTPDAEHYLVTARR